MYDTNYFFYSLQEKKFKLQNKMEELKDRSKRVMGTIGEKKVDMLQRWEEKSRDFIVSFLLLFGRDGPIVSLIVNFLSFPEPN